MSLYQLHGEESHFSSSFMVLGRNYLAELGMSENNIDRFLRSMLDRQSEPNRWLYLMEHSNEHIGFLHMKIDDVDRLGWGFVMEFYIKQDMRRKGHGRKMYELCERNLHENGVTDIYLSTNQNAESFWSSIGFRDSGEIDAYNNQKIMIKSIV